MLIKNMKELELRIAERILEPFGEIEIDKEEWEKEFNSKKSIRELLKYGYINAIENKSKLKTKTKRKEK